MERYILACAEQMDVEDMSGLVNFNFQWWMDDDKLGLYTTIRYTHIHIK